MINITDIQHGWLNLHIGEEPSNKTFTVSYLTDVVSELNGFSNLSPSNARIFFFDGEGVELYLWVRKEYNDIIIIWEEHNRNDNIILDRFEFNYDQFWNEWQEVWNKIKDEYMNNFDLDTYMKTEK